MEFREQTFFSQDIDLDNNEYTGCTFTRCRMKYEGTGSGKVVFSANSLKDCKFLFGGPAGSTLSFLAGLYGGGMKEVVEQVFAGIRTGNIPRAD